MASILVIDDDDRARDVIRQMLEGAGYEVSLASDGEEGIKTYKESPTDLIITDVIMPNEDGMGVIINLRKDFPHVKIIAISGGGRVVNADFLKIAQTLGAMSTLKKPFDKEDLLKAVRDALAK